MANFAIVFLIGFGACHFKDELIELFNKAKDSLAKKGDKDDSGK